MGPGNNRKMNEPLLPQGGLDARKSSLFPIKTKFEDDSIKNKKLTGEINAPKKNILSNLLSKFKRGGADG